MAKLEVFFDYLCPYCYRGHQNLKEALKKIPRNGGCVETL